MTEFRNNKIVKQLIVLLITSAVKHVFFFSFDMAKIRNRNDVSPFVLRVQSRKKTSIIRRVFSPRVCVLLKPDSRKSYGRIDRVGHDGVVPDQLGRAFGDSRSDFPRQR